jgi:hypothetical protein
MSIEKNIERVATALERIAAALESDAGKSGVSAPANPVPSVSAAPAPPAAEPQAPALTTPDFISQPPAAAAASAPFTDSQGMVAYVMESYKALGAEKGAHIQGVLKELGYSNINDVKPDHYGQLYSKIEQLKVA